MIHIFSVVMLLISCSPDYGISIQVKTNLTTHLGTYRSAVITVENDYYSNTLERLANLGGGVEVVLDDELRRLNITPAGDNPKLRVNCLFREGLGRPFPGRHGEILFTSIKWVNIKLTDIPTNRIIGEVECRRPFFKHIPPDFMKRMFDELVASIGNT
jgi:hypothetical protein